MNLRQSRHRTSAPKKLGKISRRLRSLLRQGGRLPHGTTDGLPPSKHTDAWGIPVNFPFAD